MYIKLNKLLTILVLCMLMKFSEQSCSAIRDNDKKCGYYCYTVLKPLLQYAASMNTKEQAYNECLLKVHDLELTIKHMANTITDKEKQLEMQRELGKVYKENGIISEELIKQKNNQILELKTQIIQLQSYEKDIESLENNVENTVTTEKTRLPLDIPKDSNIQSTIKANPLIVSTHSLQSKPTAAKFIESLSIDKYLGKNCIGKSSNVYTFKIPGVEHFALSCDSTIAGSGWTVIQRRLDGTENFNRNWTDYQAGFGDLRKEFFIGLDKLHLMTNAQPHELYIHLEDFDEDTRYALYKHFVVANESEFYAIKSLGEYSGTAENALFGHMNMKFSTPDRYLPMSINCAEIYESGWWFNDGCYSCNLNGPYVSQNIENSNAIEWRTWHFKPLKFVQMMIRPTNIK